MKITQNIKKTKYILKGVASYLPAWVPLPHHQHQFSGVGLRPDPGPEKTAQVYYSVWMRTYLRAKEKGIKFDLTNVAEIGPGDSLGFGIAALLFGAEKYCAFDIVPNAKNFNNIEIFEELVKLYKNKKPIPEASPKLRPYLDSYNFPLSDEDLKILLSEDRLERIKKSIENGSDMIHLDFNWYETKEKPTLIFSTAAMEHVGDPDRAYKVMYDRLNDGGMMAHTIDYSSHHTAPGWNAHWTYSDFVWNIVKGKNVYFINRWTHEDHLKEIQKYFKILHNEPFERETLDGAEYPYNISQGYIIAKK